MRRLHLHVGVPSIDGTHGESTAYGEDEVLPDQAVAAPKAACC